MPATSLMRVKLKLLAIDDNVAGEDSADQSAPEDEAGSAEDRAGIVHQDSVVDLAAEQSADDRGEDDIADGLRIVTAARELALGDDLRDDERHEHGEAETGELERPDVVGRRVVDDRMRIWDACD